MRFALVALSAGQDADAPLPLTGWGVDGDTPEAALAAWATSPEARAATPHPDADAAAAVLAREVTLSPITDGEGRFNVDTGYDVSGFELHSLPDGPPERFAVVLRLTDQDETVVRFVDAPNAVDALRAFADQIAPESDEDDEDEASLDAWDEAMWGEDNEDGIVQIPVNVRYEIGGTLRELTPGDLLPFGTVPSAGRLWFTVDEEEFRVDVAVFPVA